MARGTALETGRLRESRVYLCSFSASCSCPSEGFLCFLGVGAGRAHRVCRVWWSVFLAFCAAIHSTSTRTPQQSESMFLVFCQTAIGGVYNGILSRNFNIPPIPHSHPSRRERHIYPIWHMAYSCHSKLPFEVAIAFVSSLSLWTLSLSLSLSLTLYFSRLVNFQ